MAVARLRGMGVASGNKDLMRRALAYAIVSTHPAVVDDAVIMLSYWGIVRPDSVSTGGVAEVAEALELLRLHVVDLLDRTDPSTHPVRTVSLTGTLAYLNLLPDFRRTENWSERTTSLDPSAIVGVQLDESHADTSQLASGDLIDAEAGMEYLSSLVDLLPRARAYSVGELTRVFSLFAPALVGHPLYAKVRDGLDAATVEARGQAIAGQQCRDRGMALILADKPLEAIRELHDAKTFWFHGESLYGSILMMRGIGRQYANLGLMYAAKMYGCAAAVVAMADIESDVKVQVPQALLEVAGYSQTAGNWADAAELTEIALLARAPYLADPFNLQNDSVLDGHRANAAIELAAVRDYWPELEPLLLKAHHKSGWIEFLEESVGDRGGEVPLTEDEFQATVREELAGPLFGDLGPRRWIDFEALGVRWTFAFANDRLTVLTAEAFVATLQVIIADVATYDPVIIRRTVLVNVEVDSSADWEDSADLNDSHPEVEVKVKLSADGGGSEERGHFLVGTCFSLLAAISARPESDLRTIMETMFEKGLLHKVFVGGPYEEAAGFLSDGHYADCAALTRPLSSAAFTPVAPAPLAPSTRTGAGYDCDESLQLIRERYEVGQETLRFTLPRLLADEECGHNILYLRNAGWLDWQILVGLVNAALNWRVRQHGIEPGVGDLPWPRIMQLAREPETTESPEIPLTAFSEAALGVCVVLQVAAVAKGWGLRGHPEDPGEGALRDLLVRRYHYETDDIPHRDLFDCIDGSGQLLPIVDDVDDAPTAE